MYRRKLPKLKGIQKHISSDNYVILGLLLVIIGFGLWFMYQYYYWSNHFELADQIYEEFKKELKRKKENPVEENYEHSSTYWVKTPSYMK